MGTKLPLEKLEQKAGSLWGEQIKIWLAYAEFDVAQVAERATCSPS